MAKINPHQESGKMVSRRRLRPLCNIKSKLTQSLRLIGKAEYFPVLEGLTAAEVWSTVSGHDLVSCPKCKIGKLIIKKALVVTLEPG